MMNARLNKALVALLTVAAVGACDDPPIEPGNTDAARLTTNPSFVVVEAGATREVQAVLVNDLNNPVAGSVDFSACNALITAAADEGQTEIESGTIIQITGVTLGESCVVVTGAGFEDTIGVRVVPAEVFLLGAPTQVRAGATGNIDVELRNAAGVAVGPFTESDATFTSSNANALFFTDDVGGFDTHTAASVTVTVRHTAFGVARTLTVPITVLPAEPESGELRNATGIATSFPGMLAGDTTSLTGVLRDSIGNINDLAMDIESVEAVSSDENVVTTYVEITQDPDFEDRVDITVFAVAEGGGEAEITVTATTVNGEIDLGTATVLVLEEVDVVSVLPADANPGDVVVIAGTNLQQAGAETTVSLDGIDITDFATAITPTAITLNLPGAGGAAEVEISVDVGGATSDEIAYDFGGEVDEPANDDGIDTTLPFSHTGWFGNTDAYDFYIFTAPATGTVTYSAGWTNTDVDIDIYLLGLDDGTQCQSASSANPESVVCDVVAGNTYLIYLWDWLLDPENDGTPSGDPIFTEYTATVEMN